MIIKTISYSESVSTETYYAPGLKKWNKKGASVELELKEDDDPDNAYELARQFILEKLSQNESPKETFPFEEPIQNISEERSTDTIEALKHDISTCKELKVLESYRLLVTKNPELQDVFNKKIVELQNS